MQAALQCRTYTPTSYRFCYSYPSHRLCTPLILQKQIKKSLMHLNTARHKARPSDRQTGKGPSGRCSAFPPDRAGAGLCHAGSEPVCRLCFSSAGLCGVRDIARSVCCLFSFLLLTSGAMCSGKRKVRAGGRGVKEDGDQCVVFDPWEARPCDVQGYDKFLLALSHRI